VDPYAGGRGKGKEHAAAEHRDQGRQQTDAPHLRYPGFRVPLIPEYRSEWSLDRDPDQHRKDKSADDAKLREHQDDRVVSGEEVILGILSKADAKNWRPAEHFHAGKPGLVALRTGRVSVSPSATTGGDQDQDGDR